MRDSKSLLMNKLLFSALLILMQLIILVVAFLTLHKSSRIVVYLFRGLSYLIALYLVSKEESSSYKISWIVLILFVPFVGGILYILLGNKKPATKLVNAFSSQDNQLYEPFDCQDVLECVKDGYRHGQMKYLNSQGFPVFHGENVTYFSSGEDAYEVLLETMKKAKKFIFLEFFIVDEGEMLDEIVDCLKQKIQEGVEVRFLYDDVGSLTKLPRKFYLELRELGIKAAAFNSFKPILSLAMNNRDHKKIVVVDGIYGFTGGFNIADEYINCKVRFGYWKDSGIMFQGEAVSTLTRMFLATYNATLHQVEDYKPYLPKLPHDKTGDGFVLPYCDSPLDNERVGENVYLNMINQASRYIYISTPYLILDDLLQTALINASKRGVDVRIVTPAIPDKKTVFKVTRSYYRTLMEEGIKIYEYTPGFIHAKNVLVDDLCATVGTINLDFRSLFLHFENGVYLYQTKCLQDIKADFHDVFKQSHLMTLQEVIKGKFKGWYEDLLRIVAPLL